MHQFCYHKISTPGQDTREDGHATADTPGTGHSGHTDSGHAHLRKPAQTETHTHNRPRPPIATHPSRSVGWRCTKKPRDDSEPHITLVLLLQQYSQQYEPALAVRPSLCPFPGLRRAPTLRRTRTLSHPALSLSSGSMPPCAHHHELWRTALLANESWSISRPTCSTSELTYPTRGSVCPSGSVYHSGNAIPIPWSLSVPEMSPFRPS